MRLFFIGLINLFGWSSGLAFTPMWPGSLNQYPESLAASTNQSRAAIEPDFGSSFPKFQIHNPEIIWTAKTNYLQKPLWIYKAMPQIFPRSVISNLMSLGSLTIQDERTEGKINPWLLTEPLSFANKSNTCSLFIVPVDGQIQYWNGSAFPNHWDKIKHLVEPAVGVPNDAKIEKLGLKFLKQFGIRQDDLAQKANGNLLTFGEKRTRSYFDRRRGKYIDDEVIARGIFFNRRIDGINFAGIGIDEGCEIMYGNNAKMAVFRLVWRNLQRYQQCRIANSDEIISYIRDGQAVMTHKNLVNPADIKKLTITDCSPLYMGADGDETQDFVCPFAQVEAIADLGYTNVDIQLYCPILSTNRFY